MLKLEFQYFSHLIQRVDSMEKTVVLGKTEGEEVGQRRMRELDSVINSMDMNLGKL